MKRSLVLLLVLGACVPPPKAPPPPVIMPRPAPAVSLPPPPSVAWEDRARTPGDWTLAGDTAQFGPAGRVPILALRCAGNEITMSYPAASSAGSIAIHTTTLSRTLALGAGAVAHVPANDPLLDAMIYSRGRFMVSAAGQPDLIIPPWPEVARVVEDCRG